LRALLAWTLAAGAATLSWAGTPATVEVAAALRMMVRFDAPTLPSALAFGAHQTVLERFYADRGYAAAWTEEGRPTRQADEAVVLLGRADDQGLASADYDVPNLARRLGELRGRAEPASAPELALFDADLTLALIRYASHLAHGRLEPGSMYPDLEDSARHVDAVALVQRGLDGGRLTAEIESAAPGLPLYAGLTQALAHYRRLAAEAAPLPLVPVPPSKVAPGATFAGLPQVEVRLAAFGDLDPAALERRDGNRYTGAVVDAVKRFQ
jgi:murein L,D-transpeptidase YcbB/YkuD